MKAKIVTEFDTHPHGHIILSPERVMKDNGHVVHEFLDKIANAYKVSREDAAFTLQKIFQYYIEK